MTAPEDFRNLLADYIGYEPNEHDPKFEQLLNAYGAAVLREAADKLEADCRDKSGGCFCTAAGPLRRMADEAAAR